MADEHIHTPKMGRFTVGDEQKKDGQLSGVLFCSILTWQNYSCNLFSIIIRNQGTKKWTSHKISRDFLWIAHWFYLSHFSVVFACWGRDSNKLGQLKLTIKIRVLQRERERERDAESSLPVIELNCHHRRSSSLSMYWIGFCKQKMEQQQLKMWNMGNPDGET